MMLLIPQLFAATLDIPVAAPDHPHLGYFDDEGPAEEDAPDAARTDAAAVVTVDANASTSADPQAQTVAAPTSAARAVETNPAPPTQRR